MPKFVTASSQKQRWHQLEFVKCGNTEQGKNQEKLEHQSAPVGRADELG
jgi:hypothetical protein